jgi:hypothetical protein
MNSIMILILAADKTADYGIDLINKVNSFYNSAWDKLLIFGSISLFVVGIIIPIVIQWYQKREMKANEAMLKKEIESQISKIKEDLLVEMNTKIKEAIDENKSKLIQLLARTEAIGFHIQGNSNLNNKDYTRALADYIIASEKYLIAKEYLNLQRLLIAILNSCIPKITMQTIEEIKTTHEADLEKLIAKLNESNENNIFTDIIRKINLAVSSLKKGENKNGLLASDKLIDI